MWRSGWWRRSARRARRGLAPAVLLCLSLARTSPAAQQAGPADTARLFGQGDWALLAGLLTAQAVLFPLDDDVQREVQKMRSGVTDDVRDVVEPLGRAFPWYALSAGAFAVGTITRARRVADVGLHLFVSLALAETVTGTLKGFGGRWRPRVPLVEGADTVFLVHDPYGWRVFGGWEDDHRRSYPSGHATAAFTVASALSEEFGGAVPWVVYPIATAVAWSRLNDEVHWATDVTMGALVGTFSSRLVVRYGHRRGGLLERWLLVDVDPTDGTTTLGIRLARPLPFLSREPSLPD